MLRAISTIALSTLCLAAAPVATVSAAPLPTELNQCSETRIEQITTRLGGIADSGDAVIYENGGAGVSYDEVAGLRDARNGDRVRLCLISLPKDCPPGDERGRVYAATDLDRKAEWSLPDAEHLCGGA